MRLAAVATAAGVAYVLGWLTRQPEVAAARREASTDPLTGLLNRQGLNRQLRIRTERQQAYTIYMIDLNRFKTINDTLGHRAGDVLLQQIAGRLTDAMPENLVARLGGDEFVVLADHDHAAELLARKIAGAVARSVLLPGSLNPVTVSAAIGYVYVPAGGDYRWALHTADLAMYQSKSAGCPVRMPALYRKAMDESPRSRIRDAPTVRVA